MAKFVFKLDPALRARVAAEKQAMAALAQIERERMEVEAKLRSVQATVDDLRQSQRVALGLGEAGTIVQVRSVGQEAATITKLQLRAQQYALQLAGVYARVERARATLRDAAADRKSVELLREARLEEWKREQNRTESAMLDDVSQSRGLGIAREDEAMQPMTMEEQREAESEHAA